MPTQNPLRSCISPGLITGILRYFVLNIRRTVRLCMSMSDLGVVNGLSKSLCLTKFSQISGVSLSQFFLRLLRVSISFARLKTSRARIKDVSSPSRKVSHLPFNTLDLNPSSLPFLISWIGGRLFTVPFFREVVEIDHGVWQTTILVPD